MEFDDQISNIRNNIINWYEFKANSQILNLSNGFNFDIKNSVVETKANKKSYDYVVVIGIENEQDAESKLELAQKHLKENGTIILAFDNKFGIKYFSGVRDNHEIYSSIISNNLVSLDYIKQLLENNSLQYKVYYPLPDYKITNVIYSDEHMPDSESIMSRNLIVLPDNDMQEFSQRHALIQLMKANKEYFKIFCNSYFVEISKKQIENDVKYVNFEIYRKEEYNIKTIMKSEYVYKSANGDKADMHIDDIAHNIRTLTKYNINTLDTYENNVIMSKLAPKTAISLDKYFVQVAQKEGKQAVIDLYNRFKKEILDKVPTVELSENNVFTKYNVAVSKNQLSKMHFVKDGFVDLITQNVFYFDDKFYVYDQEWYDEYCPVEFILYRSIFYNHELDAIVSKEEQFKEFGLKDYLKVFLELDSKMQDSIRNQYIWSMHVKTVEKTGTRTIDFEELYSKYKVLKDSSDELKYAKKKAEQNLEVAQYQLKQEKAKADELENRLRIIEKSLSWRLTKPLRYASWALNFKKKMTLRDRFVPPGSRSRVKLDEKFPPKNQLTDYDFWLMNNELTKEEIDAQRNSKFDYEPKISLLTPLYNTDSKFFKELLMSLQKQTYSNWELCLADGSPQQLTKIQKLIKKEPRCKYVFLNGNKGISGNTNAALELATGDFIGLLDHDDFLTYDCLYQVVKCINENKDVEFIYTDEDKSYGLNGKKFDPYFKGDFAPDTLNSQNYICHFSVFKKSVMDKLNGFNSDFDGAQDYDIILRMSEIVEHKNILHIPKICYHWRVSKTSTAGGEEAKPWAFEAGQKAIQAHLKRLGKNAVVSKGIASGTYEVEYVVEGNPKVNILIPNKDSLDILRTCVESILKVTNYENYEIDIIENNSEDEATFEYYKKLEKNPKVKILKYTDKGFNYSRIINFGVKNTKGDFVLQLNNDTEIITADWLDKMIGYCQQSTTGAVGVKLLYPDYTVQHAGVLLGLGGIAGHFYKAIEEDDYGYFAKAVTIQDMTAVTAACIMTKREIYEQVGYMNEDLAVAFNDIDFCMKIRKKGLLIVFNPYVTLLHYESKSRGEEDSPEKVLRFNNEINKFKELWQPELDKGDPYYNPNLRLDNDRYAIRTEKIK